jgi:programmed cell death protein 5
MDDDPELAEIRRRRMAQLQAQYQSKQPGVSGPQSSEQEAEAKRANDERRAMILQQLLTSEARERLNRIRLVKPEKAQGVEDMIIRAAQMGTLGGVVDEQRLIALLEQIQQQTETKSTVTVIRRKSLGDSEEEESD